MPLPLFNFMTQIMSTSEIPVKPRRKKLEVPVHKAGEDQSIRKTYSANFNSKRNRQKEDKSRYHEAPKINIEPPESDTLNLRLSRRHLSKENARLIKENEEILAKFNELEELSVRKITKLKEKTAALQAINEEISNENSFLKSQSQELVATIEDLNFQLELSKNCRSCEELRACLEKSNTDNNLLRSAKKELEEDVNMLKTVVYRLNLQMERYQEKLRNHNVKVSRLDPTLDNSVAIGDYNEFNALSEAHRDHSHTPVSWGRVSVHTLGPLLDAYQDTISEKEDIILNYEKELSNFTGKLKEVLKENEFLHKTLTEDGECSAQLKIEVAKLKTELKTTKDQNDMLIKKCALKQDKLEEVLKCYEARVDQLKRDYSVVHEQYYKSRTEVAALREKNKALVDAQDDFKNERQSYIPLSVHTSSVNECKKWYEELKLQYEQEKAKQVKLIEEQQFQISSLSKDKEELGNKVKQLEKHIKKGESKFLELEHTLNEVQLSRSACRKQLHKAMGFAKDLVAEQETLLQALNQRQQENIAVKKIGSDIATRMDSLKSQLKDVQRDAWQEFTTVEKRMQEQREAIEAMKLEHSEEVERLQQIIREKEEDNVVLKEQTELPVQQYMIFRDKHK